MTQIRRLNLSFWANSLLVLTIISSFVIALPLNAQQSLSPPKMIVYGMVNYPSNPTKVSIGYANLERNITGVLVPQIGLLSYKPSPNRHYLAYSNIFAGKVARCEVRDLENHANIIYYSSLTKQCMPLWSGDSTRVVLTLESINNTWSAEIFDTQTGRVQKTDLAFEAKEWGTWEASASPNGQTMLFKTLHPDSDYELTALDLQTGKSNLIPVTPAYDWEFVWSPLGDKVLLVARPGPEAVYLYNVASNTIYTRDYGSSISWLPDDKTVSYLGNRLSLRLFDTNSKQNRETTPPDKGLLLDVTWMDDKQFVLITTLFSKRYDDQEFKLWKVDTQTLEWQPLSGTHEKLSWGISPNGKIAWLTFLDNGVWTVQNLNLSTNKTQTVITSLNMTNIIGCGSNSYTFSWVNKDNPQSPILSLYNMQTGENISQILPGGQTFNANCYLVGDSPFTIVQSNNGTWEFDSAKRTLAKLVDFPILDYSEMTINDGNQFYFVGFGISDDREIYKVDLETAQFENLTNTPQLTEFTPLMVQ